MLEIKATYTGDPKAFDKWLAFVEEAFYKNLNEAAEAIRTKFVSISLSSRGEHTLGQVTGNLSRALSALPRDIGDWGGIEIFVPDGILAGVYGKRWNEEIYFWFDYGFMNIEPALQGILESALNKSVKESESVLNGK